MSSKEETLELLRGQIFAYGWAIDVRSGHIKYIGPSHSEDISYLRAIDIHIGIRDLFYQPIYMQWAHPSTQIADSIIKLNSPYYIDDRSLEYVNGGAFIFGDGSIACGVQLIGTGDRSSLMIEIGGEQLDKRLWKYKDKFIVKGFEHQKVKTAHRTSPLDNRMSLYEAELTLGTTVIPIC